MEDEVIVIFMTDDMRGDHAADIEIAKQYSQHLTIGQLLDEAQRFKTVSGFRATIKILPKPPEWEDK